MPIWQWVWKTYEDVQQDNVFFLFLFNTLLCMNCGGHVTSSLKVKWRFMIRRRRKQNIFFKMKDKNMAGNKHLQTIAKESLQTGSKCRFYFAKNYCENAATDSDSPGLKFRVELRVCGDELMTTRCAWLRRISRCVWRWKADQLQETEYQGREPRQTLLAELPSSIVFRW